MRLIVICAVLILGVLIETTIVSRMAVFGIAPDIMLSIIVSYSILRGDSEGALAGLCGGLLLDIAAGQAIGLYSMLGLLVGYIVGKPFRDFYRESYLLPMFITGVTAVIYGLAIYMFNTLTIAYVGMLSHMGTVVLPTTVYTMIVSIAVYRILYAVNYLVELYEKRNYRVFDK